MADVSSNAELRKAALENLAQVRAKIVEARKYIPGARLLLGGFSEISGRDLALQELTDVVSLLADVVEKHLTEGDEK
jgi:hypothetical protein